MRIKLELDQEIAERLIETAEKERRPVVWQAEVLLRRALGLPFPQDEKNVVSQEEKMTC